MRNWSRRFRHGPGASWWPAAEIRRSAAFDRVLAAPFASTIPAANATGGWVLTVLGWLGGQPGESWQQRWRASSAEDQPDWRLLVGTDRAKPLPHLTSGLLDGYHAPITPFGGRLCEGLTVRGRWR